MLNQVYATKKAMTQAFSEGKRIPLTVLTVVPHVVIAHKTIEKDGYSAVILNVRPKKIKEVLSHDVLESKTEINLSEILIPGSIGRGTTPGRVLPGKHMAGRMGNTNTSVKNLKIHSFDPATGTLEITGCISGGRGALALITITKKYGD